MERAVSYTHLDVYKRQRVVWSTGHLGCSSWPILLYMVQKYGRGGVVIGIIVAITGWRISHNRIFSNSRKARDAMGKMEEWSNGGYYISCGYDGYDNNDVVVYIDIEMKCGTLTGCFFSLSYNVLGHRNDSIKDPRTQPRRHYSSCEKLLEPASSIWFRTLSTRIQC